jgi:hypothetical protein
MKIPQIIASRRQVDIGDGYTGYDQRKLAQVVHDLSDGETEVWRDHGGPGQGYNDDDGIESFNADIAAGWHGLHIDVCKVPEKDQIDTLINLVDKYRNSSLTRWAGLPAKRRLKIDIGGEHDPRYWNNALLAAVQDKFDDFKPAHFVINIGTYVWGDRQVGIPMQASEVNHEISQWHTRGIGTRLHNADWFGARRRYAFDAVNIAPEIAQIETDAMLVVMSLADASSLLDYAYASGHWKRWFSSGGSWFERARCAVRYVFREHEAIQLTRFDADQEHYVRERIRDALKQG